MSSILQSRSETFGNVENIGQPDSGEEYQLVTQENIAELGEPVIFRGSSSIDGLGTVKPLEIISENGGHPRLRVVRFVNGVPEKNDQKTDMGPYYRVALSSLSGLEEVLLSDGRRAIKFRNLEQDSGDEEIERIIIATGIGYGVHPGHSGVTDQNIPPEKPCWYLIGEQVVDQDGAIIHQGERAFSFARIVDGPLGNPRDLAHRKQYGI